MRVGVVILPEFTWTEARARWKSLEDRGFAHGWTYDHLAWRDLADQPWFGTVPTLAAAATATTTLPLGTWVASPNYRHPVTFAKDLLTLDDISGGRIIAGIGAGGTGWDADVLGIPELTPRERFERFTEFVTMADQLLREPDVSHRGTWFQSVRARTVPAGARDRVRFVIAGNGPRAMRFATGFDGWATYGAAPADNDNEGWWKNVGALAAKFDDLLAQAGREGADVARYLNVDTAPVFSLSGMEAFRDAAGRAAEQGFTDLVVHWPRPEGVYAGKESVLDQVADLLTDGSFTP